jgi:hypothetical protein
MWTYQRNQKEQLEECPLVLVHQQNWEVVVHLIKSENGIKRVIKIIEGNEILKDHFEDNTRGYTLNLLK